MTSADELKKTLRNLGPTPFLPHTSSFKGGAAVVENNNSPQRQAFGPTLTSNDLLNHRLKHVSNTSTSSIKEEKEQDPNVPEFLKQRLKNPAQRKAEAAAQKEHAQKTISNAISKKPITPQKPSMKPKIVPKPVPNVVNGQNSDNDDGDGDGVGKIRSGSVRDNKSFFEDMDKKVQSAPSLKAPVKPPSKPPVKPKVGSLKRIPPPVQVQQPAVVTEEENYDDVATILLTSGHNFVNSKHIDETFNNVPQVDEFHDGVQDQIQKYEPKITEDGIADEIYDDVETEEIYDDVCEGNQSRQVLESTIVETPNTISSKALFTPVKLPKTFTYVDPDKLLSPFGLEKWLEGILNDNLAKLKDFANFQRSPIIFRGSKPTPDRILTEDEEAETDELYDDIAGSTHATSESQKLETKSEKERKKEEKEKAERERKEKREKAEKERKEKKEKEKEKKRKEKEYKQFCLNPDMDLPLIGTVMCKVDYKAKGKLDLTYTIGEEINIINVPNSSCPSGKMLAQSCGTGRIGYVHRHDFGMELPPEESRQRAVSLIPTEDDVEDVQETYEEIGIHHAPPVPETPRPQLRSEAEEELYNDVDDEPAEEIYEEI